MQRLFWGSRCKGRGHLEQSGTAQGLCSASQHQAAAALKRTCAASRRTACIRAPHGSVAKNAPAPQGSLEFQSPGWGRSPGGKMATHPSVLARNSMVRRAWRATVHEGHREWSMTEFRDAHGVHPPGELCQGNRFSTYKRLHGRAAVSGIRESSYAVCDPFLIN